MFVVDKTKFKDDFGTFGKTVFVQNDGKVSLQAQPFEMFENKLRKMDDKLNSHPSIENLVAIYIPRIRGFTTVDAAVFINDNFFDDYVVESALRLRDVKLL